MARRRNDRPDVRAEYRAANRECELSNLLTFLGIVPEPRADEQLEVHHIIGGSGRQDVRSNLIVVCETVHRWLEANTNAGRLVCVAAKAIKSEVDPVEWQSASGMALAGWLANNQPEDARLLPTWRALMAGYGGE